MPEHIKEHSTVVARVAMALFHGIAIEPQKKPGTEEIIAGALLHDIAKSKCIEEECNHAEVGQDICIHHGYPEIGEIVGEHVILHSFSHARLAAGLFTAKDIIYYADKRVRHDQIVSLDQRLEYILERYGNNDAKRQHLILINFKKCQDLESYLFAYMPYIPSELSQHIAWKSIVP